MLFKGAFVYNPVLTQAIGVCCIVGICSTAKISLTAAGIVSLLTIINEMLASVILKKFSRWLRVAAYMVISMAVLTPVMYFFRDKMPNIFASLGVFFPLLAVNGLIVVRCENFAVENGPKLTFFDAAASAAGFSAAAILVGIVREMLAYGSIFDKKIAFLPSVPAFALPMGGMIALGFLAALHKYILQKHFERQPTNTFYMRSAFDSPVLKDEAIQSTDGTLSFIRDPEILEIEENETDDENDSDDFGEEKR